jgi:RNA polymerase sigma factor (sigma-70 family)
MSTDAALLRRYAIEQDEQAFAELVRRHLDLVFAAALRRTGGRTHLAEEIAQKVFCDLSRKAAVMAHHPVLVGWLHRCTRYAAIDATRAEIRRQKLAQTLTAMPEVSLPPETSVDWEQLRPVLDEAMDRLSDRDRELMLLHYFNGLTFAEAGARMNLSEDAARKRTGRALDQLRGFLNQRGVTSTSAALGLLLANQPLVAAPAGLASAVTTAAIAAAPTGLVASAASMLFMSKLTVPILSAVVAAGLTTSVWLVVAPGVSAEELAALRQENSRLTAAAATGASATTIAAVVDEYAAQASGIARAMGQRQAVRSHAAPAGTQGSAAPSARTEVTARGHRYHGLGTPHDAALTFAWACDLSDPDELGRMVTFDPGVREKAQAVFDTMPEAVRAQYPTVEAFYGLLLAASTLEAPPPGADLIERFMTEVELSPSRFATRRVGSSRNVHEYQLTDEGWKYVLPEGGVKGLPGILNSKTLAKLVQP